MEAPEVKAKLLATPAVVSSVGTYLTKPAIFGKPVVPPKYTGKAISMYRSIPTSGGLEYTAKGITVNCFGKTRDNAEDIQTEVFEALNRRAYGEDTFFLCSKIQIINPQNTGGDYNAPVEVLLRQR